MAYSSAFSARVKVVGDFTEFNKSMDALKKGTTIDLTKVGKGIGSVGNSSTKSAGMVSEFVKQLKKLPETLPKVAAFGAATAAIGAFTGALYKGVEAVVEMDGALTEFRKVSDLSGDSLDVFVEKATEAGKKVARVGSEMVQAATMFKKSGFTEEQSLQLAETAALYQNIADSQVSAEEASSFLVSQMKAFNITAQDSIKIINATNEVSNKFAVSSTDISTALSKTSSAMGVLGNSFEQTIGLVTAGTEIMTNQASKVSRGLRTIGNNIADLANGAGELSFQVGGTTKTISLLDESTGDLKSTFQVMEDIFTTGWTKMSKAEQQALAIDLAGKNQFEVFTSVLQNFSQAQSATETAINSSGSAMRENAAYMDSIRASVSLLRSEFESLANKTLSSDVVKGFVGTGTALLKFANSDIGQAIIQTTLLTTGFGLLSKVAIAFGTGQAASSVITFLKLFTSGNLAAAKAAGVLNTTLLASPLFWVAVGGLAIKGIIALVDKLTVSVEELEEALADSTSVVQQLQSEYDALSIREDLTEAEKTRLALLEKQLEIKKEIQRTDAQNLLNAQFGTEPQLVAPATGASVPVQYQKEATYGKSQIEEYNDQIREYISLQYQINNAIDLKTQDELIEKQTEQKQSLLDLYDAMLTAKEGGAEFNSEQRMLYQYLGDTLGLAKVWSNAYKDVAEAEENVIDKTQILSDAVLSSSSAINALDLALSQMNNQGYVSEDVYRQLISILPELEEKAVQVGNGYYFEQKALETLIGTHGSYANAALTQARTAAIELINQQSDIKLAYDATTESIKKQIYALQSALMAKYAGISGGTESYYRDAEYKALQDALLNLSRSERAVKTSAPYVGGGKSASSGAKVAKKTLLENLKETLSLMDKQIEVWTKEGKATTEIVKMYQDMQEQIHDTANKYRDLGYKETSEEILELKSMWWKYADDIKAINKSILESRKNDLSVAAEFMVDKIQQEIDILEERKKAISESYDKQIEELQKANQELDDQIAKEKALEDLAKAKVTRQLIFKDGRFQYASDIQAVSSAQEALDTINREQQLKKQIEELESAKDRELAAIDSQIAGWENYKKQWSNLVNDYQNKQNQLLATQVLGIDAEGKNWKIRLENLQNYVNEYNAIMAQLSETPTTGGGGSTISGSGAGSAIGGAIGGAIGHLPGGGMIGSIIGGTIGSVFDKIKGYAGGTNNAQSGIHFLGERGMELGVTGSGDGVIKSELTKNLMAIGRYSPSQWFSNLRGSAIGRGETLSVQIGSVNLPDVKDANGFITGIKNLAYQRTYKRD